MLIYLLTLIDNEGDRQTFTAIYQEYHVQMEKVALRILSEHNDAEDAVQNAWIQVIKHFHKVSEIPLLAHFHYEERSADDSPKEAKNRSLRKLGCNHRSLESRYELSRDCGALYTTA